MSEMINILAFLFIGGFFSCAAYLAYKKEWTASVFISLLVAAFFFIMAFPATREFMRTTAWAAFVTTLEATGQGLVQLNITIDNIRKGMEVEQKKRQEQQDELDT